MITLEGFRPGQIIAALQRIMTDIELRNRRCKKPSPKIAYNIDQTPKICREIESVEVAVIMNSRNCDWFEKKLRQKILPPGKKVKEYWVPEADQITMVRSKTLGKTSEVAVCMILK